MIYPISSEQAAELWQDEVVASKAALGWGVLYWTPGVTLLQQEMTLTSVFQFVQNATLRGAGKPQDCAPHGGK